MSVLNGKPKHVLCLSFTALSGDLQGALCPRGSRSGNTTSLEERGSGLRGLYRAGTKDSQRPRAEFCPQLRSKVVPLSRMVAAEWGNLKVGITVLRVGSGQASRPVPGNGPGQRIEQGFY